MIAEAIRRGDPSVVVPRAAGEGAVDYRRRVHQLRRSYTMIAFTREGEGEGEGEGEPSSREDALELARVFTRSQVELIKLEQQIGAITEAVSGDVEAPAMSVAGTRRLHEALDAYATYARDVKYPGKEFGRKESEGAIAMQEAMDDRPLSAFGIDAIEKIVSYWTSRPPTKHTGKPLALETVRHRLRTLKRFLDWLHRTGGVHVEAPGRHA